MVWISKQEKKNAKRRARSWFVIKKRKNRRANTIMDINGDGGNEKTEEQFYTEFAESNPDFSTSMIDELKRQVDGTRHRHNNQNIVINGTATVIRDCTRENIKQWTEQLERPAPNVNDQLTVMAVLVRACQLHKSYAPRFAQLVAIWTKLLWPATVIQMKTGEGKTLITAIEAAFHSLQQQDNQVDVITSSPLLATAAVEEWRPFFAMVSLSVAHNGGPNEKPGKMRECYKADIVYGDLGRFRGDFLRHEFKGENTRGNRHRDQVIVDEADEALIDRADNITMLSGHTPGMEMLEPILVLIHFMLMNLWQTIEYSNERKYYLRNMEDGTQTVLGDPEACQAFMATALGQALDATEINTATENSFTIPKHLVQFVHEQKGKWIKSAISSLGHRKEGNFVIKEREGRRQIVLVDWNYTGMIMDNTVMGDGLQQFLQIRESLKISAEGLTTCYISTKKYLSGYASVSGMTGTVGGPASRGMLKTVYGLDTVLIPTFKKRRFKEHSPIFVTGQNHFNKVAVQAIKAASRNAVLIICRQIAQVESIKQLLLLNGHPIDRIRKYSRSDREEEITLPAAFRQGDIIVATNLGGRGTDFRMLPGTTLHVLLTFYPATLRTEQQAFGRTSRCGQKGTGQMILNIDELAQEYGANFEQNIGWLRQEREQKEQHNIDDFIQNSLPKLMLADELFSMFCVDYKQMRDTDKNDIHKLAQVEELFGFEVRRLMNASEGMSEERKRQRTEMSDEERRRDDEIIWQEAMTKFNDFIQGIKQRFEDEENLSLFTNPCHLTRRGCQHLHTENFESAIKHFEHAEELDAAFSSPAHYNHGIALLESSHDPKEQAKILAKAKDHFDKSSKLINDMKIPWIYIACLDGGDATTDLQSQMDTKLQLLEQHIGNYQKSAIAKIQELAKKPGHFIRISKPYKRFAEFYNGNGNVLVEKPEIHELETFGFPVLYTLEIIKPKTPFSKRLKLFLIGCAQVVLGIGVTALGYYCKTKGCLPMAKFLNEMGSWLIKEGFKDMYKSIFEDLTELTVESWVWGKSISLAIKMAEIGLGALANYCMPTTRGADIIEQSITTQATDIGGSTFAAVKSNVQSTILKAAVEVGKDVLIEKARDTASNGITSLITEILEKKVRTNLVKTLNEGQNANATKLILGYEGSSWFETALHHILATKQSKVIEFAAEVCRGAAKYGRQMSAKELCKDVTNHACKTKNGLEYCKQSGGIVTKMQIAGFALDGAKTVINAVKLWSFVEEICRELGTKIRSRQTEIMADCEESIQRSRPGQPALSADALRGRVNDFCQKKRDRCTPESLQRLADDLTVLFVDKFTSKMQQELLKPTVESLIPERIVGAMLSTVKKDMEDLGNTPFNLDRRRERKRRNMFNDDYDFSDF